MMNDLERYYVIEKLYLKGFKKEYLNSLSDEQLEERVKLLDLAQELWQTNCELRACTQDRGEN